MRFPEVDAFIANEGELGFAALAGRILAVHPADIWATAIDGVIHRHDGLLLKGAAVGLSLDLAELPSPYLTGLMDPFLQGDLLPGVQTSRLCPYSCSFCVSGKNRGKLRGFPLEQVKAELDFIAAQFSNRPHMTLHINDENFGILARDAEIAEHILVVREKWGFPNSLFVYHDKRLTDTTRRVVRSLSPFSVTGVTMALQTESPEALKVGKRQAVAPDKLSEVMAWASENDLPTATELIFGLPGETASSFAEALDTAIFRGFDSVLCNNLFIVDGIELNRAAERQRLGIVTRFRQVRENYGMVSDQFCAEVEEVVVATRTFSMADFMVVRKLGILFYACFSMRFHYWLISHFKNLGVSISRLMQDILDAEQAPDGPAKRLALDVEHMVSQELYDTAEAVTEQLRAAYIANGHAVGGASQLNILFGARLIYLEQAWIDAWILSKARAQLPAAEARELEIGQFLIDLYRRERVDIQSLQEPEPMLTHWDVLAWRREKFQKPLTAYPLAQPLSIRFTIKPALAHKMDSFRQANAEFTGIDLYVNLLQTILPRSDLLMQLDYL